MIFIGFRNSMNHFRQFSKIHQPIFPVYLFYETVIPGRRHPSGKTVVHYLFHFPAFFGTAFFKSIYTLYHKGLAADLGIVTILVFLHESGNMVASEYFQRNIYTRGRAAKYGPGHGQKRILSWNDSLENYRGGRNIP